MYNPITIANYFIHKSFATGNPVTPMKLVKLVYISHGWYLSITGKPLIDEAVQAWKYGPVISSVYHAFKSFGNNPITSYVNILPNKDLPPDVQLFLDKIWDVYGKFDGLQLSTLTHQPNSPWDIVWNKNGGSAMQGAIIGTDIIGQHYNNLKAQNNAAATVATG